MMHHPGLEIVRHTDKPAIGCPDDIIPASPVAEILVRLIIGAVAINIIRPS